MTVGKGSAVRIGTLGGALGMAQTGVVARRIEKMNSSPVEIISLEMAGGGSSESASTPVGVAAGIATLRKVLLAGECDLVVHSLNDLPTAAVSGLRVGAILKRADARDVLLTQPDLTLSSLPQNARVGVSSARAAAQVRAVRPDIEVREISGTSNAGIGLIAEGSLDGIILAAADVRQPDLAGVSTEFFELSDWPTAPGQGALAVEVRDGGSPELERILRTLEHAPTRLTVTAERAVLARMESGSSAPVGAIAVIDTELLFITATVWSVDGSDSFTSSHAGVLEGSPSDRASLATELGFRVADELLGLGVGQLAPPV